MSKNTGGTAFPSASWDVHGEFLGDNHGMTLRDYFAAKAMQGQLSTAQVMTWEQYAHDAYRMADAMLAERDK